MKKNQKNTLVFIMSSFLIVVMCGSLLAQNTNPPGLKYIKESELKKDLYTLADAHFNGRSAGTLDELKPGMIFTIEPMINAGRREIREMNDGWTIKTKDRSLSA